MKLSDIRRILRLLGPAGTIAGLKLSEVGTEAIRDLALAAHAAIPDAAERDEIIEALVAILSRKRGELKPIDELMHLNFEQLMEYFTKVGATNEELLSIMKELNYKVRAEDRKHLRKYVARQISETALFAKVADRGNR